MKKFFTLFLASIIIASFVSCGEEESSVVSDNSSISVNFSEEASKDLSNSTEESETESAEESKAESTEESETESAEESETESAEESETESAEESETESTEESETESTEESEAETSEDVSEELSEEVSLEDPEDAASLEETMSYKLITSIDASKGFYFSMSASQQSTTVSMNTGIFGDKYFAESVSPFGASKTIVKDGKEYLLNSMTKTYTVADSKQTIAEIMTGFIDGLFGSVEYVKTVREEVNGVVYLVDCFKSTGDGSEAKIYVNADNRVDYMLIMGVLFEVEMGETLPEGCFDIPADYVEAKTE
ncbi:MAG: hypothetical protein J6V36_00925 [Clostridia bacterium]|nr:hypothetical protein [Clostridia bacterium]